MWPEAPHEGCSRKSLEQKIHRPRGGSPPSPPQLPSFLPPDGTKNALAAEPALQTHGSREAEQSWQEVWTSAGPEPCVSLGVGSFFSEHLLRDVPPPKPSDVTVVSQSLAGAWRRFTRVFVMLLCVSERVHARFL